MSSPAPTARGATAEVARGLGTRFRAFQAGALGADLADGIHRISLPLLALSLTHSGAVVAAVAVALRLPWFLVTLPAGVIADRHHPLTVLRYASWGRLPIVAAMSALAWQRALPSWGLVLGAFLVGACGTVADLAEQSLLPYLVEGPLIARANAGLQTGQTLAAQFAGPALGGFLAVSVGLGLGVSAALYAGTLATVALLVRRIPTATASTGRLSGSRASFRCLTTEMREGARYFRARRDLIGLAAVAACGNLAFAAATTVLPLWVVAPGRLGQPASILGLVASAPALGGLAAGAVAARIQLRLGGRGVLRACAPAVGLCYVAVSIPTVPAAFAGMACYGALSVLLNVMSVSHRQSTIPAELFGRVNSVYRWIILGVSPLGALLGGVVAARFGCAAVFVAAGAVALGTGLILPARLFDRTATTSLTRSTHG